jgi:short-subunit dehydrogenase
VRSGAVQQCVDDEGGQRVRILCVWVLVCTGPVEGFAQEGVLLPQMRARGSGRIINISSIVGFMPQPYMAVYAASKHAIEGYSESLDHEVREHGVRVLLVEPAWTSTAFDANSVQPDLPLQVYAKQRHVFEQYMAAAVKDGDDPATVAKEIVAAATDSKPKLRYAAGARTGRGHTMRRLVPARMFDQQLRKLNGLPA